MLGQGQKCFNSALTFSTKIFVFCPNNKFTNIVSNLGYSEIILSDISLYKLHRTWTCTFRCHETKNLANCMMIMSFSVQAWLWDVTLLQRNLSLVSHQYHQYDNVSEKPGVTYNVWHYWNDGATVLVGDY